MSGEFVMETAEHLSPRHASPLRNLGWFFTAPLVGVLLTLLILAVTLLLYQGRHVDRVFTGVQLGAHDLSGMSEAEVRAVVAELAPASSAAVTLVDPQTGQEWQYPPAELGLHIDVDRTVAAAMAVGRRDSPWETLREQFNSWYYGQAIAPVVVFDEGEYASAIGELAAEIDRPVVESWLEFDGVNADLQASLPGRQLDVADLQARLTGPLLEFRPVRLELLIHQLAPTVLNDPELDARLQGMLEPMTLYFQEPLDDVDMERLQVTTEQLAGWLRIEMVAGPEGGSDYHVFIDENAVRAWLREVEAQVFRPPQNARFYFDDNTRQLVLVAAHRNGRALDTEATLARFMEQVDSPDRSLPLITREITPTVHSAATAQELGITELITQTTTWFYGSTPERKHNIARAAAQFFGIVIAPGEEFSFNRYLGDVTEEAGFTNGLIIIGGRTVEGVGGGVCQVSTTLYQTAFWSGFPITERLEHGYRVPYYDDGEGPGMDATVFSPIVDFKFVNNTQHHLLIENYYNANFEALTFKFYSTDVGRRVEKSEPVIANVVPPNPDVWEFNEELEEGEIEQVDWAVEGSDVTIIRRVYDSNGNLMYGDEYFRSHYIPWQNIYQYGPGVTPPTPTPPPPTPEPTPTETTTPTPGG